MQNLHQRDSVARHLDAAERHIQLCRQNKYGEKFITNIQQAKDDLQTKQDVLKKALQDKTMAMDNIRLCDMLLDDIIRKLHGRAKEYDRDVPGQNVRMLLFPGGRLTPVISMPLNDEPNEAEQIAGKIESLGSDNPLLPIAMEIREAVEKCRQAAKEYTNSLQTISGMQTEAEIAKVALGRQYANNYFQAASEYGKNYAERLFPEIYSSYRSVETPEEEEGQAA